MPKTTQLKTNVILFPNRNNGVNKPLASTQTQAKQQLLKVTVEDKDDNSLLIFEMPLVLKDQLDNIENRLQYFLKNI